MLETFISLFRRGWETCSITPKPSRAPPKFGDEHLEIRRIILETLRRCDMKYPDVVEDSKEFQSACIAEAVRRGFSMQGADAFPELMIAMGAASAYLFYPSLRQSHHHLLILIGLYFAFLYEIDDICIRDCEAVCEFHDRFFTARPQKTKVLDDFVVLLLEMSQCYTCPAAGLVVTMSADYVSGLLIEHATKEQTFNPTAAAFPTYLKTMASADPILCLLAFQPSTPIKDYVQALPEMITYINSLSDILSFYKEDLEGETFNRISHTARSRSISKLDVLETLSHDAAAAYDRTMLILSSSPLGPNTAKELFHGLIAFHISATERYRLKELGIEMSESQ